MAIGFAMQIMKQVVMIFLQFNARLGYPARKMIAPILRYIASKAAIHTLFTAMQETKTHLTRLL